MAVGVGKKKVFMFDGGFRKKIGNSTLRERHASGLSLMSWRHSSIHSHTFLHQSFTSGIFQGACVLEKGIFPVGEAVFDSISRIWGGEKGIPAFHCVIVVERKEA